MEELTEPETENNLMNLDLDHLVYFLEGETNQRWQRKEDKNYSIKNYHQVKNQEFPPELGSWREYRLAINDYKFIIRSEIVKKKLGENSPGESTRKKKIRLDPNPQNWIYIDFNQTFSLEVRYKKQMAKFVGYANDLNIGKKSKDGQKEKKMNFEIYRSLEELFTKIERDYNSIT